MPLSLPRRIGAVLLLTAPALALSGCGNARTQVPGLSGTNPPAGFRAVTYQAAELALRVPRNWALLTHPAPLIVTAASGQAVIAVWRYRRPGTYPTTDPAKLASAERRLVAAATARDPGLRVIRSGVTTLDGRGAIVLAELERINGRLRRVRSEHAYLRDAEVVLEEYAPPAWFRRIDHLVFSPVRRSLHLLAGPGASG
jgi:hypothetical protein